jgi:hypothetical protein
MSGSPVYIDGRLIGALSYRLFGGGLPREPVAGVTPIEDILDAARSRTVTAGRDAAALSPIGTPVLLGGMIGPVREWVGEQLEEMGFVLVGGGEAEDVASIPTELRPGSPLGVTLVRGDFNVAFTGTVTWVDGDRVYAFGHPVLGTGRVEMPMVSAEVIHTLGDLGGSIRLSNVGAELGAIVEDRLTAVVGRTGVRARMIPVDLRVSGAAYGESSFRFELARSTTLTPLLAGMVVANALIANTGYDQEATVRADGAIRLAGLPDLPVEMAFAGEGITDPSIAVAAVLQQTLNGLWRNPFDEVEVDGIDLRVAVEPEVRRYRVDAVLYDRDPLRPGDTLTLRCVLSRYREESVTRELTLDVPAGVPPGSRLSVAVGSPLDVERALGGPTAERLRSAEDLESAIRVLGERRSAHRLRAVLFHETPAVISRGAIYDDLPPTAARLLSAPGASRRDARRRLSRLSSAELEMDGPIEGGLTLRLQVDSGSGSKEEHP